MQALTVCRALSTVACGGFQSPQVGGRCVGVYVGTFVRESKSVSRLLNTKAISWRRIEIGVTALKYQSDLMAHASERHNSNPLDISEGSRNF